MNVEREVSRSEVIRVWLGDRYFAKYGFAQGGDDPVRQGGGYVADQQGKGGSDFRDRKISQPGNRTAESYGNLCQK